MLGPLVPHVDARHLQDRRELGLKLREPRVRVPRPREAGAGSGRRRAFSSVMSCGDQEMLVVESGLVTPSSE